MNDIQMLRNDPERARVGFARRGLQYDPAAFTALDAERREAQSAIEAISRERNQTAEAIAAARRRGEAFDQEVSRGERAKREAEGAKARFDIAERALQDFAMRLPNLPALGVPDGKGEADNKVLRQVGVPAEPAFEHKEHDTLGTALGGLDFEAAAKMSGARFAVALGPIARLHRALIQFMLDTHVDENGYVEAQTPYLVRAEALEGTGQLPKFEEDLFRLERDGLYLIPTAEVPVTNLIAGMRLAAADLPVAFVAHTPCFRREAGSAGRDVKGLVRQHQFEKVELVRACEPEDEDREFELLLAHAEGVLARLEAPYRLVELCAGDLGFSARRTVDLEVWLPGQKAWREISSVSQFGDFQARRMGAKFIDASGKRRHLATLNGSGLAAGRALVAVMENHQRPDGSIGIPAALRPYMKGMAEIPAPATAKLRRAAAP